MQKLKSAVMAFIQPLAQGVVLSVDEFKVSLGALVGFGNKDAVRASQYGLISHAPNGVSQYFLNLAGDILGPVIVSELDKLRPSTSNEGETILYSRSGSDFTCLVTLKPSGMIEIVSTAEVKVESPTININGASDVTITTPTAKIVSGDVEVGEGALEKIVNGETFQTLFNNHKHIGNMGVPTDPPMVPMAASELSSVVKAAT